MSKSQKAIKSCINLIQEHPFTFEDANSQLAIDSLQTQYLQEVEAYTKESEVITALKRLSGSDFIDPPVEADPLVKKLNETLENKKQAIIKAAAQQNAINILNEHYEWLSNFDIPNLEDVHTHHELTARYRQVSDELEAAYNAPVLKDAKALLGAGHELVDQAEESYAAICSSFELSRQTIINKHNSTIQRYLAWIENFQPAYQDSFCLNEISRKRESFLDKLQQHEGAPSDLQLQQAFTFLGMDTNTTEYLECKQRIDQAIERSKLKINDDAAFARKQHRLKHDQDIPMHVKFDLQMYELEQKINHMKDPLYRDKYAAAIEPAETLQKTLIDAREAFLTSDKWWSESLDLFQRTCLDAMNPDITPGISILEQHRDWNQFIANFVGWTLTIATVFLFAPVAYGLGLFSRTTDTMRKVNDLRNTVSEIDQGSQP